MVRFLRVGLCVVILALPSRAVAATIDFDSLGDSESLTNQIPGVTFSNATVLSAGISLNEFEFPPRSGSNIVFDDGGAMSIAFASPIASFGGYFTYLAPLTLEAFSPAHVSLGSVTSAVGANTALSGDAGSSPNELLQLAFAAGIGSVTIIGLPSGGSFVLDDAFFAPLGIDPNPHPNAPVPEPATLTLLGLGCLVGCGRRRMTARQGQ